jgi:hypothetical protein
MLNGDVNPENSILLAVEPSDNEVGKNIIDSKNKSILVMSMMTTAQVFLLEQ